MRKCVKKEIKLWLNIKIYKGLEWNLTGPKNFHNVEFPKVELGYCIFFTQIANICNHLKENISELMPLTSKISSKAAIDFSLIRKWRFLLVNALKENKRSLNKEKKQKYFFVLKNVFIFRYPLQCMIIW